MTYEQIHNLFKQRYNQNNWKQFLGEAFAKSRLLATPETLTGIDSNVASQVQKLGYITLNENGIERQIAVYDVTLAQGIILERNRVGLRNLLRKYWKDIDAAFITYHNNEKGNWRFTYVSELTGYDADGEFVKIKTEPKRYTYVLGEGESTRTAAERFTAIANKGSKATLDDVKEAFSVEKLSKAFFDEYKKHYDIFCDFMVSKPNIRQTIFNGDEKGIRDFNKKLLGRIVFLYFIQKKGWLGVPAKSDWGKGDFDFLTNLFKNTKNPDLFYSELLSKLFFDTLNTKRKDDLIELVKGEPCRIPYLNGGLFEEDDKKHRNLIFDAQLFKNLFDFFNQYNFTIYEDDPNDHTVAVDPEMLGHIFENLLEDNKDKGAYYTPKEIVHYMCQESLIEYLCTSLQIEDEAKEKEAITNFLKKKEIDSILKTEIKNINKALDSVKICDPAIGSGAFPMGLLHEIFTAKQTLHTFEHGNTKTFDASSVKLNIIQNSIYGVDIEKGAVDIARLRFWLSLIVDEEKPKALPNLDYKIVVGNSLVSKLGDDIIDIDWTLNETSHGLFGADLAKQKGDLLKKISKEQKEFFNPDSYKKKLAADIRKLKIDLLITQLELMVKTQGIETKPTGTGKAIAKQTELFLQTIGWKNSIKDLQKLKYKPELPLHFFDWKLDFPEVLSEQINSNAGFDIVIGNPPYVRQERLGQEYKKILKNRFPIIANGTADLYVYFFGIGLELLKEKGVLSYITLNKYLKTKYGIELRNLLASDYSVDLIIDFFELPVFEASTDACITKIIAKEGKRESKYFPVKTLVNLNLFELTAGSYQKVIKDETEWKFIDDNQETIIEKLYNKSLSLKEFTGDKIYYGVKTGANHIFIIDKPTYHQIIKNCNESKKYIHPYLEPTKFDNWSFENTDKFIIGTFPARKVEINKAQGLKTYLSQFRKELEPKPKNHSGDWKGRKSGSYKWFETQDNIQYWNLFFQPKIIFIHTAKRHYFYQDEDGFVINNSCYFISSESNFLFCFLNSKLFEWFKKIKFVAYGDAEESGRAKLDYNKMITVPIKNVSKSIEKIFSKLVENIKNRKSQGKETNTLEQEIDNLVYKLYELTYDEVKVIDPAFSLSKKEYEAIKLE